MQDNPKLEEYKERLTNFSHEFDLGLFLSIVRKSVFWVVILFFLAVLASVLYLRYTPEIYEARAVLQVGEDDSGGRLLNVNRISPDNGIDARVELIRSKLLVQRTLDNMDVGVSYFAKGRILTNEHYILSPYRVDALEVYQESIRNQPIFISFQPDYSYNLLVAGKSMSGLKPGQRVELEELAFTLKLIDPEGLLRLEDECELYFRVNSSASLASRFVKGLDVRILNNTAKTIELGYKDNNPFLAKDFVTALSHEFIRFDLEKRQRSDENILAFIDAQIDTVYERLRNSEVQLNAYKQDNKITNLSSISGVYLDRLTELENRIIELEVEERLLRDVQTLTNAEHEDVTLKNLVPLIAGSAYEGALSGQLASLQNLLEMREEMLFTATTENNRIKSIDYQIGIQKGVIVETINALRAKVEERKDELNTKLRGVEEVYYGLPTKELEFARLERLFAINEKYYTMLLEKRIEYQISKEGYVTQNQILDEARMPTVPISPRRNMIYLSFILAGIIVGFIFISIRYLLHNEVTSLNEIVRMSNASISTLGVIPKYKELVPISMLLVDRNPKSMIAESFRTIRTNMQFIDNTDGPKVTAVTSTISGEGKTFIALNLAGIIAFSKKKVIVLDLDMRRPKIHKGMELDNARGMSSLLSGQAQLDDCIQKTKLDSLHVITAGPIPPNPSELIISKRMEDLVEALKERYDMIIIDTPPVGLVTDGIDIISKADYPLYVFRADYSKKQFVQNVDRLINENGIARMSVILNGVDLDRNRYSYSYGYGYGYGYGYNYNSGYYDDEKRPKKGLRRFWS